MIQSALFFLLGFFSAALVALLLVPFLLRRTERLTRRRLVSTLPMSLNEMHAETDSVRAEQAMKIRKVEIDAKLHQENLLNARLEIARLGNNLSDLSRQVEDRDARIAEDAEEQARLSAEVADREAQIVPLQQTIDELKQLVAREGGRLEEISRLYEEALLISGNRQVELIERDSAITRLTADIERSNDELRDNERRARDSVAASLKYEEDLRKMNPSMIDQSGVNQDVEAAVQKLEQDRNRLEERLASLATENLRLQQAGGTSPTSQVEFYELREAIAEIAAQMVQRTRTAEGTSSAINAILERSSDGEAKPHSGLTLAERIRQLAAH